MVLQVTSLFVVDMESLNSCGCQVDADGYWVVNAYSIEIAMYLSSNSYDCHVDADRYWVVNAYYI